MKTETISLILLTGLGIVMGYIGFLVNSNWLSLGLMIIVLIVTGSLVNKIYKKNFKWVLSNGGWVYIFLWFITWIILYNL